MSDEQFEQMAEKADSVIKWMALIYLTGALNFFALCVVASLLGRLGR